MIRRVAAAADGSDGAASAIEQAFLLAAGRPGGEVVVVDAWAAHRDEADLRAAWQSVADDAGVALGVVTVEGGARAVTHVVAGLAADVLVVAAHGKGDPDGPYLGSTASHLVFVVQVPVVIVPAKGVRRLRTVVVGVDGSAHNRRACQFVARLVTPSQTNVVAVTAFDPSAQIEPPADPTSTWERLSAELEGPWTEALRCPDVLVSTRLVRHTNPVDGLRLTADEVDADAVVVGRHGRGTWAGSRVGRTALSVVHHIEDRAVVVVP